MSDFIRKYISPRLMPHFPILYPAMRRELKRFESLDLVAREQLVRKLLRKNIKRASRTRFYTEWGVSTTTSYDALPLVDKNTLRSFGENFFHRSILPTMSGFTGGSSGVPIHVKRSLISSLFQTAVQDHLTFLSSGIEWKDAKIAILRGARVKDPSDRNPPFWKVSDGGKTLELSSFHLSEFTASSYAQVLNDFNPDILWVYPSSLEQLLSVLPADFECPSLKVIFSSSEILSKEVRAQAARKIPVNIIDFYCQAERICCSYSLDGKFHYFLPIYGMVELVYSHDDDRFSYYEVIGSSFWNSAMPIIKYQSGDMVMLSKNSSNEELDAVCLGLAPFYGVAGRANDYILSPEGEKLIAMNHVCWGVSGVLRFQVCQPRRDRVIVKAVVDENFSVLEERKIISNARKKIPESMSIEIERVTELDRTAQGKVPFLIREGDAS